MRGITNAADAERLVIVSNALVRIASRDPRIEKARETWAEAWGLPALMQACRERPTPEAVSSIEQAILDGGADAVDRLTSVCAQIGLHYDWLPYLVALEWAALTLSSATADATGETRHLRVHRRARPVTTAQQPGESARAFARRIRRESDPSQLPAGRRAKHQGDDLIRNVEWFYRTAIKEPRDTIGAIAREFHASRANLSVATDSRSAVQQGIERARALLDAIVLKKH